MYYKIIPTYNSDEFIQIEESEVEKAYYAFLSKKDSIYSGGAIRGSDISRILPDYHRVMGWNRGHKLDDYDFAELKQKGVDTKMQKVLFESKERVQYLIATKQEHLVGKHVEIPQTSQPVLDQTKQVTEKFKINTS